MTLKEFTDNLNEFIEENPNALNMQVVTSKDDEGNGFYRVTYSPSLGNFDDGEFESKSQIMNPENGYDKEEYPINAVCVN